MFDFEKLHVYQKAKDFNLKIKTEILSISSIDAATKNQLRRASLSIMLNIAEGTSRFSNADKRNFYVISRGSLIESLAILDLLNTENIISNDKYLSFYELAEALSKILFSLIRGLEIAKK